MIEKKIADLEALLPKGSVPGTQVCRVIADAASCSDFMIPCSGKSRVVWAVAVGKLNAPKHIFYGETIEKALDRAAEALLG